MRIGYRPREIALHDLPGDSTLDVTLAALPPLLETVEATSRRVCPGEKGTSRALELWEQARTALLAGVVAREAGAPTVRLLSFTRSLEPAKLHVLRQQLARREVVADKSYVAARPAWAFAADGYMRGASRRPHLLRARRRGPARPELRRGALSARRWPERRNTPARSASASSRCAPAGAIRSWTWPACCGWAAARRSCGRWSFIIPGWSPRQPEAAVSIIFRVMPNGAPMIERWRIRSALLRRRGEPAPEAACITGPRTAPSVAT